MFLPVGAAGEGSVVGLLHGPDITRYALPAPESSPGAAGGTYS